MRPSMRILSLIVVVAVVSAAQAGEPVLVLKGFDPVELAAGREAAGRPELTRVVGHYRYQFVSEESRSRFDGDPARYAVQLGGSCGRMGPLSGLGSPDRFHVHAGRIYLFASDACMSRFKGAPDAFLPADDPRPEATEADLRRGGELVALALKGLGGAGRVDALKGLRYRSIYRYEHEGKAHEQVTTLAFGGSGEYRRETTWATGGVAAGLGGGAGFRREEGDAWRVDEAERHLIRLDMLRHPVALLRSRNEKGFLAAAGGRGRVGEAEVEWLRLWHEGALTTLGVDTANGTILSAAWRGFTSAGYGEVSRTWSDFREVAGLMLPYASIAMRNGKPDSGGPVVLAEIAVDPAFESRYFMPVD